MPTADPWHIPSRSIGVHPGAPILAALPGRITCLLGDGTAPTHLLTAGHLFGTSSRPGFPLIGGTSGPDLGPMIGVLVQNLLDCPPTRLGFSLDAALVELTAQGVELARLAHATDRRSPAGVLVSTTRPESWRVQFIGSSMHGPAVNVPAVTAHGAVRIPGGPGRYGFYEVRDPICAPLVAPAEDAGSLLLEVSAAPPGGLGLYIGSCLTPHGVCAMFEPLDRLITCINVDRPRPLTLWPPVAWSLRSGALTPASTCPLERTPRSADTIYWSGFFRLYRDRVEPQHTGTPRRPDKP